MTRTGDLATEPEQADLSRTTFATIAALQAAAGAHVASDAELEASRGGFLAAHPPAADLWIFGYGSLMWNPAVPVAETRPARIDGHRRSFCIEVRSGRASPERPGLILGLVAGGSCTSVAHRIRAADVGTATAVLWWREIAWGSYRAAWVPMDLGGSPVQALTFVTDAEHAGYCPELAIGEQAARIAVAEGVIGTNRDYLLRTRAALVEAGLVDAYIQQLWDLVDAADLTGAR